MNKAMYAFSGDPITYGHIDIVERAAKAFDEVVVGIGVNPDKKYMFSLEERTDMAKRSLGHVRNIEIVAFKGLLVDYAYENCIPVIVKGVRDARDFDYEKLLHEMGESQKVGIETFVLYAKPELGKISSSSVKAMMKEQGFIHEFVPLNVKQQLEARMLGQYIVGITGAIGAGKSYVSERLVELGRENRIEVYNVELDNIGHQILSELQEPRYKEVRKEIADKFGKEVQYESGEINRKALGETVFNDLEKLQELNEIMLTPIMVRLRKELKGKKGIVLLNAALLAEMNITYLCNNNVILVDVDPVGQERRLSGRGLSAEQTRRRIGIQYSTSEKRDKLYEAITKERYGQIWIIQNNDDSPGKEIESVFERLVQEMMHEV